MTTNNNIIKQRNKFQNTFLETMYNNKKVTDSMTEFLENRLNDKGLSIKNRQKAALQLKAFQERKFKYERSAESVDSISRENGNNNAI